MVPRSTCSTCMVIGAGSMIWKSCTPPWISRTRRRRSVTCRMARPVIFLMLEARDFVEAARARGFQWYAGVPCSYLTPFINYVLQDESLRYVSAANEGDAVALIAGIALSGGRGVTMMQNS